MSWFKKKKEVKENSKENSLSESPELSELPELPKLPGLPKFPDISEERFQGMSKSPEIKNLQTLHALPSFPGSKFGDSFNQETIKSAVNPPITSVRSREIPTREKRTIEISESKPPQFPKQRLQKFSVPSQPYEKLSKKIEPVYIRIDKFQSAVKSFQEIKNKVSEIESLLSEIKEIKQKEDEEFREWEHELETIKARIGSIDNTIFSKLD